MNNRSSYIQIYLLFFSLIFITSCNGQDKTNEPKDSTVISNTNSNDTSVTENQATNQIFEIPWIDPLFYIDGQLCQHVRRIFQDKSGTLWFGTNVYGLMRYNKNTLEYFTENDGLGGGRITGIVEDVEGNVWFGTYGGLTKYDARLNDTVGQGESFTNFSKKDGLVDNEIWSLIIDSQGIFWIGTSEGVSRFDGERFTSFPIPKAEVMDTTTIYSYDRITCIMEDRNGAIWFGTDGFGICKYDLSDGQAGFTHITTEDGLCDNNIHDIMEDTKGNIWIGTMYGGVSRYDGRSFTNFTENGVIDGIEVGGLYEDKSGNIWFAAENFGVYRFDASQNDSVGQGKFLPDSNAGFTNFYTKDGLNTNGILSILEDREGRFWFGGWGGLFRYNGKSFFSVTNNGPWEK